ncbi:ThiF family adenylyltransferase [Flavobacterium sp. C3NV]|uniref:ThiF family adenylyltransferase n=1 Tax=Flavobacterium sp. C3NV TaxID=3393358 RepID=UPI00398FC4EF
MESNSKLSTLVSHNEDLKKLVDKGYAVSMIDNYLVVRDIPYLDDKKNLHIGEIVSKVIFIDEVHVRLEDHQIFFCGSHPHELTGKPIANLGGGATNLYLSEGGIVVQRSFSNKPDGGFTDFFEKIESYVSLFSGPAMSLFDITPFTFRLVETNSESVFKFHDTLTSRAGIGDLSAKLNNDVVAIIGLGGTGSYLLDFLVNTPVKEIKAFDLDDFHVHNAYRSPGKTSANEFGKKKAEVYRKRYSHFRKNINIYPKYIQSDSDKDLFGVTFAFVCVDKGSSRKEIFDLLIRLKIPFIDVGMGLDRNAGAISGTLRTTYFSENEAQSIFGKNVVPVTNIPEDVYRNNIQISELNALNACLAVVRYKQLRGFYVDDSSYYNILFTLDNFQSLGE